MGGACQRRIADPSEAEERVTVDDGVEQWTATTGAGPAPVVLCHGGAGLWDYLDPVAELLGQAWRDDYHREADRRLKPEQRQRRDALARRPRSEPEEREWRTLSYAPGFANRDAAFGLAAGFAAAPYPINFECNKALNDEERATVEADLLPA